MIEHKELECKDCGGTFKATIQGQTKGRGGYGSCPVCNVGTLVELNLPKAAMVLVYDGEVKYAAPIRLSRTTGYPLWMAYNSARIACEDYAEKKYGVNPEQWFDEWGEWWHRRTNGWLKVGLATIEDGELKL
jgi:hypothetical protein